MKFKVTMRVEVDVEHVIDVLDEELEGFDWANSHAEDIAAHIQKADDASGSEYTAAFPNLDLSRGIGEVYVTEFIRAEPVTS